MAYRLRPTLKLLAGFSLLAIIPTARAQLVGGFVENRGQWPDEVLYMAQLPGQTVWVTREALVYDFYEAQGRERTADPDDPLGRHERNVNAAPRVRGHVVELRFDGGSPGVARAGRALTTRLNYFLGNDPTRHATHVAVVDEVTLDGLYDGVALRLRPVADVLALTFEADDPARLARVQLSTTRGETLVESDEAVTVTTSLGNRRIGLVRTTSAWRTESSAPSRSTEAGLVYSTFLGATDYDYANALAVGADGSATVVGYTGSPDFPTTSGAYDDTFNGDADDADAFVARLSADGSSLLYATFLGGTGHESSFAAAVGADGSTTISGNTVSADFPTTSGAYDETFNGTNDADTFVARLSADGASLLYSTFLGGTAQEVAFAVGVGGDGAATVAGYTTSADFPTTPGAFDESFNGGLHDAFVARLSADGTSLLWSTYLGGTSVDPVYAVAVGTDGAATVAGYTASPDFPITPGAYDETFKGGDRDAFVARLSPDGASLLYSTYLGGTDVDIAFAVGVGADGSATVAGYGSPDFPTTSGAYDETFNGDYDAFVTRLSADGTSLLYSTFLGGADDDFAKGVAVGADGSATVAGYTWSADFPTTPGAYDETHDVNTDAFVARLSADGSSLLYSTLLGGLHLDEATAVGLGADGSATVTGVTRSSTFPTTAGAFDETHNVGDDVFVTMLQLPGPTPIATLPTGPGVSALHGAAPNPFDDMARLRLDIADVQGVTVRVYDVSGREVAQLLDALLVPGVYEVVLGAAQLPSGVYFVRANGERFAQTQLVTRIR
jgi:hypothetical protein